MCVCVCVLICFDRYSCKLGIAQSRVEFGFAAALGIGAGVAIIKYYSARNSGFKVSRFRIRD